MIADAATMVDFGNWADDTPYLAVEMYGTAAGGAHYYGILFRWADATLERCCVAKQLTHRAAVRLNKADHRARNRPGDLTPRMESIAELEAQARRVAKALWGWNGSIERCQPQPSYKIGIDHHETEPGRFSQRRRSMTRS